MKIMKKYSAVIILLGLFVAIPVLAQTTGGQNPNQSLWETIMALTRQLGGLQQTAAVVSSTNANVAPGPTPGPTTTSGGCGQTLTPYGTTNQTIRCDGANWVAAGNLLNDGLDVAIGPREFSGPNFARLYVNNDNSNRSYFASIHAKNSGNYSMGVSSSAVGTNSTGVYGEAYGLGSVGILGEIDEGSASSTGVLGKIGDFDNTSTAVKATTGRSYGHGFYQQGDNAKNVFDGKLGLGIPSPTERLEIRGGMKFSYSGNSPTCNDGRRGTLWFNHGGSSGIDSMLVCAKITATSTYAWRNLF